MEALSEEEAELEEILAGIEAADQGYVIDSRVRKAIEAQAMKLAREHFESLEYQVKDVSRNHSFDLLCRKGDEVLQVEVKGTTSDGSSVLMSKNEVELAKAGKTVLFRVANIEVTREPDGPTAVGGACTLFEAFVPTERSLQAMAYRVSLMDVDGIDLG